MASLIFKPLRFIKPTEPAYERVTETDEAVTVESWLYGEREYDGTEVCTTFMLTDVIKEETVLAGYTTSQYFKMGIVTGWSEGKYFHFDGPNEGSLLWNRLMLVRGPLADKARERYEASKHPERPDYLPPPMKRTDSGTNYGFMGHPDLEFWERSGIQPWYAVPYPYEFDHDIDARNRAYDEFKLNDEDLTVIERRALTFMLDQLRPVVAMRCLACGPLEPSSAWAGGAPASTPTPTEEVDAPPPLPEPASPVWPLEPAPAPRQGAGGESGPFIGLSYERAILLAKRMKENPVADPYELLANETLEADVLSFTMEEVVSGLALAFGLTRVESLKWRLARIDEVLYD